MYKNVATTMDFAQREQDILDFWREIDAMRTSIQLREGRPVYSFFDGPPTANGAPHFGHVITRAVKDLFPRYKTMKGRKVLRKAGWDTHGLPVELEVEKELGISGKPQIEIYGIEPFIKKCKASVLKYEAQWRQMSERVGFWADMDAPYITYHNDYIESVWWAISEIWKRGLVYKSYRVVPYCPRCGTPLSSHEVAQGYKEVTEDSAYVAFEVDGRDEYILAWTTTPWTLPSNVGLCVNPTIEYARVRYNGRVYVLASVLVEPLLGSEHTIIETMPGSALAGIRYKPLFAHTPCEGGFRVVCDEYVTLTDGTGVVHIAPAFGEDDARVSKANDLPFLQLVDAQGLFLADVPEIGGMFVKTADPVILQNLRTRGLLFKKAKYTHNYPFCWRCKTPLIYYARDAWFIKMSEMRDDLLRSNATVNWLPANMRDGRFGQFLENVIDWSISRERYWGTPLPIWVCDNSSCAAQTCMGSITEMRSFAMEDPGDIELHKPYIDAVKLKCKECGGQMTRTPEVLDCWFDSGSMPFAQWHYPFESSDLFETNFPADFISEGLDQTRGWFYSLMAISTLLFDKAPFKNVIVTGLGLDENGQKMSKSVGNVTHYMDALDKHGADALRWYLFAGSAPWQNFKYSPAAVTDISRRFLGTLWNTYAFYVLYANIDNFNPYAHRPVGKTVMDRWLLSRLNGLVAQVDAHLAAYELTAPARAIDAFVDEMSNWYLRLGRERFWASGMEADKISAFCTLHHCLVTVAKLAAPFVPFITEQIYQNLVRSLDADAPQSVHHCLYPVADAAQVDMQLEEQMACAMQITALGRAARNQAQIKTRQPLSEAIAILPGDAGAHPQLTDDFLAIVRNELNVKHVRLMNDAAQYVTYRFKPQLRTLGPKYGKLVPKITEHLNADPQKTAEALRTGSFDFAIEGQPISLAPDDVLSETMHRDGYYAASGNGMTVVLNTTLTPDLLEEGVVREIVSKFQNMRRDADFQVTDRITAGYSKSDYADVIQKNAAHIRSEILADSLKQAVPIRDAYQKAWEIDGKSILLWVKK